MNYLPGGFTDDTPTRADGMRMIKALDFGATMTTPFSTTPLTYDVSINGGGALIIANNGKCEDTGYVVVDQYDNTKCVITAPLTVACCALTGAGMLCDNTGTPDDHFIAVADEIVSAACAADAGSPVISY